MAKTVFQKIIDREIPSKIAYEDDLCLAIHDIDPQAPVHVILFPKRLIPRLGEATPADQNILGHLMLTTATVAKKLNLDAGYRIVINNGPHGGETVPHLHIHILGGRPLTWPPG